MVHEYAHGLWQFAEQEAKEGRTTLRDKFHKIAKSAPSAVKKAVGEAYKLQGPSVVMEECFTHELARKSEQNQEFAKAIKTASGKSWYKRAWRTIKDTWGGLARKMGYGKADIDKMENMNAHESAEYILKQMAQGKHFGDINPTPDGSGKVRLPNGKESRREVVSHPGGVAVLPLTDDGNAIFILNPLMGLGILQINRIVHNSYLQK